MTELADIKNGATVAGIVLKQSFNWIGDNMQVILYMGG